MDRDPDPFAGAQPAGIALAPVGSRGAVVEEMRVNVYKHDSNLMFW